MGASKGWSFDSFLYAVNVCKCDLKVISSLLEEIWKAQVLPDGKGGELLSTPLPSDNTTLPDPYASNSSTNVYSI